MTSEPTPLDSGNREASETPRCPHGLPTWRLCEPCIADKVIAAALTTKSAQPSTSLGVSPAISEGVPSDPPTPESFLAAITDLVYNGDAPAIHDLERAVKLEPLNMVRHYQKILDLVDAYNVALLEQDFAAAATPLQGESSPPSDEKLWPDVLTRDGNEPYKHNEAVERAMDNERTVFPDKQIRRWAATVACLELQVAMLELRAAPIPEERRDEPLSERMATLVKHPRIIEIYLEDLESQVRNLRNVICTVRDHVFVADADVLTHDVEWLDGEIAKFGFTPLKEPR